MDWVRSRRLTAAKGGATTAVRRASVVHQRRRRRKLAARVWCKDKDARNPTGNRGGRGSHRTPSGRKRDWGGRNRSDRGRWGWSGCYGRGGSRRGWLRGADSSDACRGNPRKHRDGEPVYFAGWRVVGATGGADSGGCQPSTEFRANGGDGDRGVGPEHNARAASPKGLERRTHAVTARPNAGSLRSPCALRMLRGCCGCQLQRKRG